MKRDTRAAYRARAAATERRVDEAVAAVQAERDAEHRAAREVAAAVEAARVRLTRDDILGATHVRTPYGWHKVARVNKTTVSVETAYSWTDRYPFDKILEVRTVTA
ncbi:hypothetical protein ABIQ69_11360 [Agromyces sp. G08B096]|uniref:Uncharacterized protein n=1 Tax=Agromyces sp. G08B096 TaxID=3156399 RepID=A0AAU7W623_9MICO